jgi:hypothetical protein
LVAVAAAAGPGPLLDQVLTATTDLSPYPRAGVLVAVAAAAGPGPLLDQVLAGAVDLDTSNRAKVLVAVAAADPERRGPLLDQVLTATTTDLETSERAPVLAAVAGVAGPKEAAQTLAVAHDFDGSLLSAIARSCPESVDVFVDHLN